MECLTPRGFYNVKAGKMDMNRRLDGVVDFAALRGVEKGMLVVKAGVAFHLHRKINDALVGSETDEERRPVR